MHENMQPFETFILEESIYDSMLESFSLTQ